MRNTTRRLSVLAVGLVIAAALAGCKTVSDQALRTSLSAIATPTPPPAPTPTPTPHPCSNLTASLRPAGRLPAPGQMPAGSEMRAIERRGQLIAGVDQNTLLFGYLNPFTGRLEGFEIDILRQLAKAILGNPNAIRFKAITTAQRISAVQQGKVDLVADAFTITCARRREVAFSTVYYDAGQRVLVPKSSHATSLGDLRGQRVCATAGSTSLDAISSTAPDAVIPYPVAQRTDCLVALQEGTVAAITSDDAILLGFKAQDPQTKIIGPRFADEPYGIAIAKGHPDLVRFVNAVLARIRADGTWAAIYGKWLGSFSRTPPPPTALYEP